jgi:hypothetical protein
MDAGLPRVCAVPGGGKEPGYVLSLKVERPVITVGLPEHTGPQRAGIVLNVRYGTAGFG